MGGKEGGTGPRGSPYRPPERRGGLRTREIQRAKVADRNRLIRELHEAPYRLSHRAIGRAVECSHQTVSRVLSEGGP